MRVHSILILEGLSVIGGGQRVLLDILPAMSNYFKIKVALPSFGKLSEELSKIPDVDFLEMPIPSFSLSKKTWFDILKFILYTPLLAYKLNNLIRKNDINMVFANTTSIFIWGTLGALLAGKKILWYCHCNILDKKTLWLVSLVSRLPNIAKIVGSSQSSITQFNRPSKSVVVKCGVDLDFFTPCKTKEEKNTLRDDLKISHQAKVIGVFADFIPIKQQHLILEAIVELQINDPDIVVLLVGNTRTTQDSVQYKEKIDVLINQSNAIVSEWTDNLPSLIRCLDFLAIASMTETGPLVLYQALACGIPVISTPVGHVRELLGDEKAGLIVESSDINSFKQRINQVLNISKFEYSQMQINARKIALEKLDLRICQEEIISIINGIDVE